MTATCRDCGGANTVSGCCPQCGSCCECYCLTTEDRRDAISPICGHLERARCASCGVCQSCDGCYCGED